MSQEMKEFSAVDKDGVVHDFEVVDTTARLFALAAQTGIIRIESPSTDPVNLRDLASGCYVLYGKFRPFAGSTTGLSFSSDLMVNIIKKTSLTSVQVFYPVNNCVQFLAITDDTYERTNVYLNEIQEHIGTIDDLTTTEKTSLVGAINELDAEIGSIETALDEIIAIQESLIAQDPYTVSEVAEE